MPERKDREGIVTRYKDYLRKTAGPPSVDLDPDVEVRRGTEGNEPQRRPLFDLDEDDEP